MSKKLILASLLVALAQVGITRADVFRDDFNTSFNYSTGAVPAGGIWDGIANPGAGGGPNDSNTTSAGNLTLSGSAVGWENNNDTAPFLYKNLDVASFNSVTMKISAQTQGDWSLGGPMVRIPNPLGDGAAVPENWYTAWSFRPAGVLQFQRNRVLAGQESEGQVLTVGTGGPNVAATDLAYLRITNRGLVTDTIGGVTAERRSFKAEFSADGSTWWPLDGQQSDASITGNRNINMNTGTVQVGVAYGAIGTLAGAQMQVDWIEINAGTPPNCLADGICTWQVNGSGNLASAGSWKDTVGANLGSSTAAPNSNTVTAVFGDALVAGPATAYTNGTITVKELRFDSAQKYVLAGAGQITLDADAGNALINVNQGTHEIQVDLSLSKNVTATAQAGTVLNINAPVKLNGNTLTVLGAGTIMLNNGTIAAGSGSGSGSVVNDGSLAGVAGIEGNLTQSSGGNLSVLVGADPMKVSGAAVLDGTLTVAVADGFTPVVGQTYTVLTADSITNMGLSLSGDSASDFRLSVGSSSLSVTAIPEPSSILLVVFGCVAGLLARRRQVAASFFRVAPAAMPKAIAFSVASLAMILVAASESKAQFTLPSPAHQAQNYLRYDLFGNDATPNAESQDYTAGTVFGFNPATTGTIAGRQIWADVLNPTNGGDPFFNPASFISDGTDVAAVNKAGRLDIEDLNAHVNTTAGQVGVGYEGDKNNAPALVTRVDASKDFDAFTRIQAQYAGQWSLGGLLVRRVGPTVGKGPGDAVDATEQSLAVGDFRTDAANPGNAVIHAERVINGASAGDLEGEIPPTGAAAAMPFLVRISKRGTLFSWASCDPTNDCSLAANWVQPANAQVALPGLSATGDTLQIGPTYMRFVNPGAATAGLRPNAEFDWFQLNVFDTSPKSFTWVGNSGSWGTAGNWLGNFPGATFPSTTDVGVTFGPAIASPQTVFTNTDVITKSITFNNANKYVISGAGRVTLTADTGPSSIDVQLGSHEIQTAVTLSNATNVTTAAGTRLDVNNELNLNGQTLTVSGAGNLYINNNLNTATNGTVNSTGNIGGSGRINGPLNATGGSVNPGSSAGTLTVEGNFVQSGASTKLNIELGGTTAGTFDKVVVLGTATLAGVVDVSLLAPFAPTSGTWDIVTSIGALTSSMTVDPGDIGYTLSIVSGNTLRLTLGTNVPGDYNHDGTVNAADYTVYRNRKSGIGGTTLDANVEGGITPGLVTIEDYNFWKGRYGATSGSGSGVGGGSNVPEPASIGLLMLALVGACGFIRQR